MEVFFLIGFLIFLFGTIIGSFLNVVIDRVPRNESLIKTRSHCEHCRRTLSWIDLIPVFSYIFLGGKCRYCHKHIGYYYPTIEFLTGVLFLFILFLQPFNLFIIFYYFLLISCLIVITFTDFKYGIIPFPLVVIATIGSVVFFFVQGLLFAHLIAALGAFALFLALFFITKQRGIGFGDVVYAFLMGIVLGYPLIIIGMYIAFLTGAIVSLILIGIGKKKLKGDTIPFGPFLVIGTLAGLFFGTVILQYVLRFI